ncbi:hypothetical protein EYZ11_009081 [Aspergillus tanneri]|uniref:Uncharacterized protein n=1 Tax=Aspergillus tanneri TaxID=1220188 RepID=A0A4S3JE96_9EURO|nr:hypothetical protein EYZ11_009081 [Aspergillus tanneri]
MPLFQLQEEKYQELHPMKQEVRIAGYGMKKLSYKSN